MSGLPEENLAKSGLRIRSKVLISAEREHIHLLKVFLLFFFFKHIWVKISET